MNWTQYKKTLTSGLSSISKSISKSSSKSKSNTKLTDVWKDGKMTLKEMDLRSVSVKGGITNDMAKVKANKDKLEKGTLADWKAEMNRVNDVIAERKAKGLDTSAQTNYKKYVDSNLKQSRNTYDFMKKAKARELEERRKEDEKFYKENNLKVENGVWKPIVKPDPPREGTKIGFMIEDLLNGGASEGANKGFNFNPFANANTNGLMNKLIQFVMLLVVGGIAINLVVGVVDKTIEKVAT